MRRRGLGLALPIGLTIAILLVRVLPKALFSGLARLIPIEDVSEPVLILVLGAVFAALLVLAIIAFNLLRESRSGAAAASDASPTDDSQREA